MMSKLKALTLSLLLVGACAGAWADSSMLGTGGYLLTPDPQVLPGTKLTLSGSYLWVDRNDSTQSNEWFSVNYGALENFEVGLSKVTYRTRQADDVLFQAKYFLRSETAKLPAIAIGTLDITNDLGLSEATAYVVASRFLWAPQDQFTGEKVHPVRGMVGYGTGLYGNALFAGLDWQLRKETRVVVEYAKNRALGTNEHLLNLGAQATFGRFSVNAAAIDMKHPALSLTYAIDSIY